jgi:bla regulator protein blaR1
MPLRFALLAVTLIAAASTQSGPRKPVFEAATIKPTDPAASGSWFNTDPGRMDAQNWTFKSYVLLAYSLRPYQLTGISGWMDSERFNITAKLEDMGDDGLPSKDDPSSRHQAEDGRIRIALQALLAERFGLKFHRESKTITGYAMSLAKGGFKPAPVEGGSGPSMRYGGGHLTAKRASMQRMAVFLESELNQPVADLTNLPGFFDFTLDWTPEELRARSSGDAPPASSVYVASDPSKTASIFTALQEQLGLKLETKKLQVDTIVVDSAERPSAN